MERQVLKEQLKEAIGGRKVLAAVFYTFNFAPSFFENYVMPLLVPGKEFKDETIYNNFLWRRLAREGLIPPVTVYCDHYAKDNTMAPVLGYDIRCIRLPGERNMLVNFHPKECWILLDNQVLLQVNGSANLTLSGWCENLECFAIHKIEKDSNYPRTVNHNNLQRIMHGIARLSSEPKPSEAEFRITEFLKYTNDSPASFSSIEQAFSAKVNEVIDKYQPALVEVIAPYLYGEQNLVRQLRGKGLQVNCLLPTLKGDEVMVSEETFISMREKGVMWCRWAFPAIQNEPRNLHAKVYRLYGMGKTITITGSVNFTNPAWKMFVNDSSNQANIESGMIHVEDKQEPWLLPQPSLEAENLNFLERESQEISEVTGAEGRDAPLLNFVLNWKERTLSYAGKLLAGQKVRFKDILQEAGLQRNKAVLSLSSQDIGHLAKNALIELVVTSGSIENIYAYYPAQLENDSRPLNFRLSPSTILKYWLFGDDPYQEEMLSAGIAETVTDDSGFVDEEKLITPSLLNEMALHFTALVGLEKKLFDNLGDPREQFNNIRYYLLTENLDTLPFYLNGLREQAAQLGAGKGFYWMILQLLAARFYDRAVFWPHKNIVGVLWRPFRTAILARREELTKEAAVYEKQIDGLKEKAAWLIRQLNSGYGK